MHVGRHVNWYGHRGEQHGGSSEGYKLPCDGAVPLWVIWK